MLRGRKTPLFLYPKLFHVCAVTSALVLVGTLGATLSPLFSFLESSYGRTHLLMYSSCFCGSVAFSSAISALLSAAYSGLFRMASGQIEHSNINSRLQNK